jgi:hypothetical protein
MMCGRSLTVFKLTSQLDSTGEVPLLLLAVVVVVVVRLA